MLLTSRLLTFARFFLMACTAICCTSISGFSQNPNPNSIITFNPRTVSVGPGGRQTVAATLMEPAGPPTTNVVNTRFGWKLADKRHDDFVQILTIDNRLTVVGVASPPGTPRPSIVPVIVTYIDSTLAVPLSLSTVLNIALASPTVSTTWDVLPSSVCKHSFGRAVGDDYYCIEVTITNRSGFDLQIADAGFELSDGSKVSSTGYNIVRNTLRHRNMFYPRAIVLNTITALGPLLTGFTPYFHNAAHRGNFTEGINILSNPLEKGLEKAWPDPTGRYLDSFDGISLREGVIIPNNGLPLKTRVFYPKKNLRSLLSAADRENPAQVRRALNKLDLQGVELQYVNAIRITTP